jgi:hypothetical protein
MDPNLQQLLWAVYPLACFWLGILCSQDDLLNESGGICFLVVAITVVGHLVALGFIAHAVLRAFHLLS